MELRDFACVRASEWAEKYLDPNRKDGLRQTEDNTGESTPIDCLGIDNFNPPLGTATYRSPTPSLTSDRSPLSYRGDSIANSPASTSLSGPKSDFAKSPKQYVSESDDESVMSSGSHNESIAVSSQSTISKLTIMPAHGLAADRNFAQGSSLDAQSIATDSQPTTPRFEQANASNKSEKRNFGKKDCDTRFLEHPLRSSEPHLQKTIVSISANRSGDNNFDTVNSLDDTALQIPLKEGQLSSERIEATSCKRPAVDFGRRSPSIPIPKRKSNNNLHGVGTASESYQSCWSVHSDMPPAFRQWPISAPRTFIDDLKDAASSDKEHDAHTPLFRQGSLRNRKTTSACEQSLSKGFIDNRWECGTEHDDDGFSLILTDDEGRGAMPDPRCETLYAHDAPLQGVSDDDSQDDGMTDSDGTDPIQIDESAFDLDSLFEESFVEVPDVENFLERKGPQFNIPITTASAQTCKESLQISQLANASDDTDGSDCRSGVPPRSFGNAAIRRHSAFVLTLQGKPLARRAARQYRPRTPKVISPLQGGAVAFGSAITTATGLLAALLCWRDVTAVNALNLPQNINSANNQFTVYPSYNNATLNAAYFPSTSSSRSQIQATG